MTVPTRTQQVGLLILLAGLIVLALARVMAMQ
jgi:hypothetical protein